MIKSILVPVDGSESSKKALEFACDLALKYDAKVHLLHVVQHVEGQHVIVMGAAAAMIKPDHDAIIKQGKSIIKAAEEIAQNLGVNLVSEDIEEGDPATKIVECAKVCGADMIALGSRGLSDFAGLLLGSVSHKVTHSAPCNCLTIH